MSAGEWWLDGLVLLVYFTTIIGIGLRAARGQKTIESYALGDRSLPWWAVLASILASEISAGTFLGTPGEGFAKRSFLYAQLVVGTLIARIIVAGVFIKPFYDLKVVSIYQFLEIRFGTLTKRIASFVFMLTRALASGSRLYVAAILIVLATEVIGGLRPTLEQEIWIYACAVVALTLLTTIYTALGGIKAVVWTDLIQVTLMFGAAGYVFTLLWNGAGGWNVFRTAVQEPAFIDWGISAHRSAWGNVKAVLESEYTVWAALLGSVFTTMATHGTDQDMVQRMLTARDHRRSRLAVIGSGLIDLPVVVLFLSIGILLHLYYTQNPQRAPQGDPGIFAWFIVHDLPAGLRGLLAAGLFATAMGSLSTALNALATTFTKDWYVDFFRPAATSAEQTRVAKWSTAGFAVLLAFIGIGTAILKLHNPDLRIIPIVLGSFGYTYGSLLGVFLIGMLTRTRGSCRGNATAMLAGFLAVAVLSGLHNDAWDLAHPAEAAVRRARDQIVAAAPATPEPTLEVIAARARLAPPTAARAMEHRTSREPWFQPPWLPRIEFTWRILAGTLVTVLVGLCFTTPPRPGRSDPGLCPAPDRAKSNS